MRKKEKGHPKEPTKETLSTRRRVYVSVLLVLLALVSISAATIAWFTIADRTRLKSMDMEITSGTNLRFDLDAHDDFSDYVKTLNFEQIADRIQQDKGFDMREVPLEPVTTEDAATFTLEDGTVVEDDSGAYLEFTLHFIAVQDMYVHLTSANSGDESDGTAITSSQSSNLPSVMRISFTVDDAVYIYDPGIGDTSSKDGDVTTFGLASADKMECNDNNGLFYLTAEEDKSVVVHIWLEGTDENCTDDLRNADYAIQMRFEGTDSDNNLLS